MHRSASLLACCFPWLCAGCYGTKVFTEAGGGGAGAGDATISVGPANGGSPDHGGGGSGGGGGALPTVCTAADEGMPCDGGAECAMFECVASTCTLAQLLPAGTEVGDNDRPGDCVGMVCSGDALEPALGPIDDPPMAQAECSVGSCMQGVPGETPGPPGAACTGGVCSGDGLGCVECIGWANCAAGEVCVTGSGTCSSCSFGINCGSHPAGSYCKNQVCGCEVTNHCQNSPAGARCKNDSDCGCSTPSDCVNAAFGTECIANLDCGCQSPADCTASSLGQACIASRCGCEADGDCPNGSVCDVTANVCVSSDGSD